MPKRNRTSSVELIAVDEGGFIIGYNNKKYYVNNSDKGYLKFFEDSEMEIEVIHNFEHRAMFNVEDIRSGDIILRQEINLFKFKDVDEWMKDE
jgi:hypothetical protein